MRYVKRRARLRGPSQRVRTVPAVGIYVWCGPTDNLRGNPETPCPTVWVDLSAPGRLGVDLLALWGASGPGPTGTRRTRG